MRKLVKGAPSPALVIAVIALFAALAGGAYAINVGKNAIKTKNIANGAVKTKKIANNAATTAKLANSAVTTAKLANSAVTPAKAQVAFAKVSATAVKSNDEKVNSVSVSGGIFCFDLAFTPKVAVASLDAADATEPSVSTEVPGNATCPAGQRDASVATDGGVNPIGFFVVFY